MLATAAGVPSPALDSQNTSMKDSYVRQWISGTLRAASISASPAGASHQMRNADLSDGEGGNVSLQQQEQEQQQMQTETSVGNNVWTLVKSMPLYSDECPREELLLLGEKMQGTVAVPRNVPEDFIDESSLILPAGSASSSVLQPRGQRTANSDGSEMPAESKCGRVWTSLARMPIAVDCDDEEAKDDQDADDDDA
eukprot:3821062-Rhodomonas_salina.1